MVTPIVTTGRADDQFRNALIEEQEAVVSMKNALSAATIFDVLQSMFLSDHRPGSPISRYLIFSVSR
jgi:hypothetical protein